MVHKSFNNKYACGVKTSGRGRLKRRPRPDGFGSQNCSTCSGPSCIIQSLAKSASALNTSKIYTKPHCQDASCLHPCTPHLRHHRTNPDRRYSTVTSASCSVSTPPSTGAPVRAFSLAAPLLRTVDRLRQCQIAKAIVTLAFTSAQAQKPSSETKTTHTTSVSSW